MKKRSDSSALKALDSLWLIEQPIELQAGLLLHAFRKRVGLSQEQLAEIIGFSRTAIHFWEKGTKPIPVAKLDGLIAALKLSDDEATQFKYMIIPTSPEFDSAWLAQQPPKLQAGLLLFAFRERKGLTQRQLAEILGISQAPIHCWEKGANLPTKLDELITALELSDEEENKLRDAVALYEAARKTGTLMGKVSDAKLGATAHTNKFSQLRENERER